MTREEQNRRNRENMRAKRSREYRAAGRELAKGQGNGRRYTPVAEPSDEELDRRALAMDRKGKYAPAP